MNDSRFAAAGGANKPNHLSGFDAEVHIAQDRVVRVVAEGDVLEHDSPRAAARGCAWAGSAMTLSRRESLDASTATAACGIDGGHFAGPGPA